MPGLKRPPSGSVAAEKEKSKRGRQAGRQEGRQGRERHRSGKEKAGHDQAQSDPRGGERRTLEAHHHDSDDEVEEEDDGDNIQDEKEDEKGGRRGKGLEAETRGAKERGGEAEGTFKSEDLIE